MPTRQTRQPEAVAAPPEAPPDVFARLSRAARSNDSPRRFCAEAASAIAAHFGASAVLVTVFGSAGEQISESCIDPGAGRWSARLDRETLAAQAQGRSVARVFAGAGGTPSCALVSAPIFAADGVSGGIAVLAPCTSRPRAERLAAELSAVSAHVANLLTLRAAARADESPRAGASIARILNKASTYRSLDEFAFAIANSLRTKFECDQAAFAEVRRSHAVLRSISGMDELPRRSPGVHAMLQAMDECADLKRSIIAGPGAENPRARLHTQWSGAIGGGSVLSVPIGTENGAPSAVVSLRRPGSRPFTADELRAAEELVVPLAAAVPLVRDATMGPIARTRRAIALGTSKLFAPTALGRKLLALVALAALGWVALGSMPMSLTLPCTVEPIERRVAGSPAAGRLAEVFVRPGDAVAAGAPLLRMDTRELELERQSLDAERLAAEIELARAVAANQTADARLLGARARLAQDRLALVDHKIAESTIRATLTGIVIEGDLQPRVGEMIAPGEPLITIAAVGSGALRLELTAPERLITELPAGATIELQTHARPESIIHAELARVAPSAVVRAGRSVFIAKADLTHAPDWLRPGMEGVAHVHIGERRVAWALFHRLADSLRLAAWPNP